MGKDGRRRGQDWRYCGEMARGKGGTGVCEVRVQRVGVSGRAVCA